MTDDLINSVTKDSDVPDELFLIILETTDELLKTQIIEKSRRKFKSLGRLREFNTLLNAWIAKYSQEQKQEASNKTNFTGQEISLFCGRYQADDKGVLYCTQKGVINVCPHPILPIERLVNIDTGGEKINISFFKDEQWHNVIVDCATAYNKSSICSLADRGLIVTSENSREIVKYISEVVSYNLKEIPLFKAISRLGWINKEQFAPYVKDIRYDGDLAFEHLYKQVAENGDFETWLKHISSLRKNIYLRLMMAASFASALIELLGTLPFVFHLWGTTGFGKTVSLMVAMSIWGNPELGGLVRTMNMTQVSMARTSAFLYNIPFAADELQQIKDRWNNYDQLIMYLCEGIDRGRGKANGGIEEIKTWRNAFIFTGEEPITKSDSGGGAKNRVIEIEVDEQIIADGNYTVNIIKENYGFAGKMFVDYVKGLGSEELKKEYRELFRATLEQSDTTEKQAMAMALILLADKLACSCVFENETPLQISDVKNFLMSAKQVDAGDRAYDWFLNWVAENQLRFTIEGNNGLLWGKIEDGYIMINKTVLESNLKLNGYDYTATTKAWAKKDLLEKNSQGKFRHQTKVFSIKASYIKVKSPKDALGDLFTVTEATQEELPF